MHTWPRTGVNKTIHLSSHIKLKMFQLNPKEVSSLFPFFIWWSWASHSLAGILIGIFCAKENITYTDSY